MIARGDVYWVDFRGALGAEIGKVRPAVVVSEDDHNACMGTVTVVPLSSAPKGALSVEVAVPRGVLGDGRPGRLKPHQIRAVDKSRLGRRIGALSEGLTAQLIGQIFLRLGVDVEPGFLTDQAGNEA